MGRELSSISHHKGSMRASLHLSGLCAPLLVLSPNTSEDALCTAQRCPLLWTCPFPLESCSYPAEECEIACFRDVIISQDNQSEIATLLGNKQ